MLINLSRTRLSLIVLLLLLWWLACWFALVYSVQPLVYVGMPGFAGWLLLLVWCAHRCREQPNPLLESTEQDLAWCRLAECSPDLVMRRDREGRTLYVNARLLAELGRSADQLVGKTVPEAFPDGRFGVIEAVAFRAMASGETVVFQAPMPNGRMHQIHIVPERGADGAVVGTVLFGRDITALLQSGREACKAHEFLRQVVDAIADPIFVKDRQNNWVMMNDAFSVMLGQPRGVLPGRSAGDARVQSPLDLFGGVENSGLNADSPQVTEEALLGYGGELHYIQTKRTLFISDDGEAHVVGVVRDLTERRNLEDALKASEQALRQSRDQLRDLIAREEQAREDERKHIAVEVHEDLGQNLMALHMSLAMLRRQLKQDVPTPLEQQLEKSWELLSQSIQTVRAVAVTLHPKVLDLGAGAALEWLAQAFTRRTAVACELRVDAGPVVVGERCVLLLFRIAEKLLDNVARHAEATRVEICLERREHDCFLCVQDNGKGFEPGNMYRGTALSLRGVRERVRAMGGDLAMTSCLGSGTVIEVRVPVNACGEVGISPLKLPVSL